MNNQTNRRFSPIKALLHILQGIIIGAAAILPGISGGVLSVTFGIYEPLIQTVAAPRKHWRNTWRLLAAVGIGWVLGFLVFAGIIGRFYELSPTVCICAMIGLVAGTFPELLEETGKYGHSRGDWFVFTVVLFAVSAFMMGFSGEQTMNIEANWFWMFLCGVMWGFSFIVPGMTFSPVIVWLGLFDDMSLGISALDPAVLIPFALGLLLVILSLARTVAALYKKCASQMSHAVLALAVASTLSILPRSYDGVRQALFSVLALIAGFVLALLLARLGKNDKDGNIPPASE